jgi:hypothetical protein
MGRRHEAGTVPCGQPQHKISLAQISQDPPRLRHRADASDIRIGGIGAFPRDAFGAGHGEQATLPPVSNRTFVTVVAGILIAALLVSVVTLFI